MEKPAKFIVDYSETSQFRGIRILYEYLAEGLEYAQKHQIEDVCVWSNGDWTRQTLNFDFLQDLAFIKTFHFLIPLSKKSDISGLCHLENLNNLRWAVDNDFAIDFARFPKLKSLNTIFSSQFIHFNKLQSLTYLQLNSVKTADLSFLSELKNLEKLRIINGGFSSLKGLEYCENLQQIMLQKCNKLTDIEALKSRKLQSIWLESCKKIALPKAEIEKLAEVVTIL